MLHMKTSGLIFGGRLRCFFCGRFLPTARCFQTRTHHHLHLTCRDIAPGSIPYNVTCLKWPLWKCLLKKSCRLCGSLSLVVSCTTSLLWCIFWIQTIHLFSKHFETTAPAPSWNTLLRKGCNSLLLRSHTCRPPPKPNFLIVIFRPWDEVQKKQRQVAWHWLKAFPWTTSLRKCNPFWPLGPGQDARKIPTAQNTAAIKDSQKTWPEKKQNNIL